MTVVSHRAGPLIDGAEISRLIEEFSLLNDGARGVTRLGYSPREREAHALFASYMREIGALVWTDSAGNTIAELPAAEGPRLPAIGTGSHLDSVPEGGRFDGIAGVCTAMVTARAAVKANLTRSRPWRIVAFAAEEGARFGQACNGSRAIAGTVTQNDLDRLHDSDGVSLRAAMKGVGLTLPVSSARWTPEDWHAFVELHVEQGNVLEHSGVPIGIVDSISGSSRIGVVLEGTASHTGATPMHLRRDALTAAAEIITSCEEEGRAVENYGTRVTVGRLEVNPGSITTIPGRVDLTIDVRDFDGHRQRAVADALCATIRGICERRGIDLALERIGDTSPVLLPSWLIDRLIQAAESDEVRYRVMPSGASHDSQQVSLVVPTGMIFVPSQGGLSHVPEEWTSSEELAVGARVLLNTLLLLDERASG